MKLLAHVNMQNNDRVLIVLPVFNDWISASRLLVDLDMAFSSAGLEADVLIVDDGSTESCPADFPPSCHHSIRSVRLMELWCNCGHQRAIVLGLAWCLEGSENNRFLVMDSDGEDLPADAIKLIQAHVSSGRTGAVFAERKRRSEGLVFRMGYHGYRLLHFLLTGIAVRVGNFSVIDRQSVGRVVNMAESWNHYAATIFKSRVRRELVPTRRGSRYAGRSSMNLPSLVAHGVSALAVHGEIVAVRLGCFALAALSLLCAGACWLVAEKNWGLLALIVLAGTVLQVLVGVFALALSTLGGRSQQGFIPGRDYRSLVKTVKMPHGS